MIKMSIFGQVLVLFLYSFRRIPICNGDTHIANCLESDSKALIVFKNSLEDPDNRLLSWVGKDCCQWKGVRCENSTGAVIAIVLHNQHGNISEALTVSDRWNLRGNIDPALLRLKSLKHLDLSLNSFQNIPIPDFFGSYKELQYLDLSYAGFAGTIPQSIGNISTLQYLDVSSSSALTVHNFRWVGGLTSLRYLAMNGVNLSVFSPNLPQVLSQLQFLNELHLRECKLYGPIPSLPPVNLSSLAVLDLSFNSFYSKFPDWIVNVTSLVSLDIGVNNIHGDIPLDISELPNLRLLQLEGNTNLTANSSQLFKGSWRRIEFLDLSANNINGIIPTSIGNVRSLIHLRLFGNNVEGEIPSSIGNLCNLEELDLMANNLSGELPRNLVGTRRCSSQSPLPVMAHLALSGNNLTGELPEWLSQLYNLESLQLDGNLLHGAIPTSFGKLSLLSYLNLKGNKLTGVLPDSLGQLSNMINLNLAYNHLTGNVSELHFLKLKNLTILDLSSNSLVLNVSSNWVPPFQVLMLYLNSCKLGPSFPSWFKTQTRMSSLSFSNSSISDNIPTWFWSLSENLSLLNGSVNQLQGQIPNPFKVAQSALVDFRSNLLEGPIPFPASGVEVLDLSNNHFTGSIPPNIGQLMPKMTFLSLSNNSISGEIPASIGDMQFLIVLDLSRNNLTAEIPSSLYNCSSVVVLDLGNNILSGVIPSSFGQLKNLLTLRLSDNKLSGGLPSSLRNCSNLETLDLGNNAFSGDIPIWVGESLASLKILRLRSNSFLGTLPSQLTNLTSLQVLDLADNNLVGTIPGNLQNLKAMVHVQNVNQYRFYGLYQGVYYEESLVVNAKNQIIPYTKTLSLVTSIDLSGNDLHGEFPEAITQLRGLVFLSLSRNHLTGHIPEAIEDLHELLSFDMSSNQLSGVIPSSMPSMSALSYLNLSNNNFSGTIPFMGQLATFDESAYSGNPRLCGAPLSIKCQAGDSDKGGTVDNDTDNGNGNKLVDDGFYVSMGLGFAAGILVPFVVFAVKRPWGDAYFGVVDKIVENSLVTRSNKTKSRRNRHRQH